jgi:hypothetical protein
MGFFHFITKIFTVMRKMISGFALVLLLALQGFSTINHAGLNAECCKVCRKGKACGDSCISRDYECHKGAGCACDG